MQKSRIEIARILSQMFPSETFVPENIHPNRPEPGEAHTPGTIRWWAESNQGTLVHTIGLTMTDFITHHKAGRTITRAKDKALGWQLFPHI